MPAQIMTFSPLQLGRITDASDQTDGFTEEIVQIIHKIESRMGGAKRNPSLALHLAYLARVLMGFTRFHPSYTSCMSSFSLYEPAFNAPSTKIRAVSIIQGGIAPARKKEARQMPSASSGFCNETFLLLCG
jgi:hypothetical protein